MKKFFLAVGLLASTPTLADVYSSVCIGNEWVGQPVTIEYRYGDMGEFKSYTIPVGGWAHIQYRLQDESQEDYVQIRYDENRSIDVQYVIEELETSLTALPSSCDDSYAYEFRYDAIQSYFISLYEVL